MGIAYRKPPVLNVGAVTEKDFSAGGQVSDGLDFSGAVQNFSAKWEDLKVLNFSGGIQDFSAGGHVSNGMEFSRGDQSFPAKR